MWKIRGEIGRELETLRLRRSRSALVSERLVERTIARRQAVLDRFRADVTKLVGRDTVRWKAFTPDEREVAALRRRFESGKTLEDVAAEEAASGRDLRRHSELSRAAASTLSMFGTLDGPMNAEEYAFVATQVGEHMAREAKLQQTQHLEMMKTMESLRESFRDPLRDPMREIGRFERGSSRPRVGRGGNCYCLKQDSLSRMSAH